MLDLNKYLIHQKGLLFLREKYYLNLFGIRIFIYFLKNKFRNNLLNSIEIFIIKNYN